MVHVEHCKEKEKAEELAPMFLFAQKWTSFFGTPFELWFSFGHSL